MLNALYIHVSYTYHINLKLKFKTKLQEKFWNISILFQRVIKMHERMIKEKKTRYKMDR